MALTREDLKNIKNIFDQGFEKNFGKYFTKAFDEGFKKRFPKAFAENFGKHFTRAFDRSFDQKFGASFEKSFRKHFMDVFDQVLHPVLDKIFAKQKEHDQRFEDIELGQNSVIRKLSAMEDRFDSHSAVLESHDKRLIEIELQRA